MSKPIIGLVALWRERKEFYSMHPGYMDWVERAGGIPVMLPYLEDMESWEAAVGTLDGILFTGGPDLSPKYYGEDPIDACEEPMPRRDEAERKLFEIGVMKHEKPVLGICKGCHILNVMMGGSLYQDIHSQYPDKSVNHIQHQKTSKPSHSTDIVSESPLHLALGRSTTMVNTLHHQAIKKLASGLKVMATAPDGIIEAFYGERGFLWGIQWHPEMFPSEHEDSKRIFAAFINACKKDG